jgi:uncharacterized membrane protein YsdA (DUF1294 family)/cold shock CspA family protein
MKPLTGPIVDWNPERGFGFIESNGQRIFLHMRDFNERHKVPEVGDVIQFDLGTDRQGRPCAQKARHVNEGGRFTSENILFLLLLLGAPICALGRLSNVVPLAYPVTYWFVVCSVTYFVYAWDKRRARSKRRREPENLLHLLELVGGWPGAFIAQRHLRHKCAKLSYQIVFWLIVAAHQFAAVDYLRNWTLTLRITHQVEMILNAKGVK